MLLFSYFDGASGPVQPVGQTTYTEGYARAELRAQAKRRAQPDVRELLQQAEGWPKNCWGPNLVVRAYEAEKLAAKRLEDNVRAEIRAQAERKQVVQDAMEGEAWLATDWNVRERGSELRALRVANWQRLCAEMRAAVEGKL